MMKRYSSRSAFPFNTTILASCIAAASAPAYSQETAPRVLQDVVVSASRAEQQRFDAPAAIDAINIDSFRALSPLVNISELLGPVPGIQVRERQNYAQDLQISARGFGSRATFGVRGVRILVDGIPATMPDGQGQASTASLTSAQRIEVLRGPLAQQYGNAAGGVLQVFTRDPSVGRMSGSVSLGAGSDDQRQAGFSLSGGTREISGLIDFSHFRTDGYRDHSRAERNHVNAKVVMRPSSDTKLTGIINSFNQPISDDPLGLTRELFESDPRQAVGAAETFDTRKSVQQHQAGLVLDHRLSTADSIQARAYYGSRDVFQTLGFRGNTVAADGSGRTTSAGGVVDLDRRFGGVGVNWSHKTAIGRQPFKWTLGVDADNLRETRRGFINEFGTPGELRRNELDKVENLDFYALAEWAVSPAWDINAGVRRSRVKFKIDDNFFNDGSDDSGSVTYRNTSPVVGVVWHATDAVNLYANLGKGFETPTLAESAYRIGGPGPNLSLRASESKQAETGIKVRSGRHTGEAAIFFARSDDDIVAFANTNGRTIFQNADRVERRGLELSWKADWSRIRTQVGYTYLKATFERPFTNAAGVTIAAGNRLPGVPRHSLFADAEFRMTPAATVGLEARADSEVFANDINTATASGFALFNARAGYEFSAGGMKMFLFGRVDNLLDRQYVGSVIVNEGNQRFYEPGSDRRVFVGLRSMF